MLLGSVQEGESDAWRLQTEPEEVSFVTFVLFLCLFSMVVVFVFFTEGMDRGNLRGGVWICVVISGRTPVEG